MSDWKRLTWGDIATLEYGKAMQNYNGSGQYRVFGTNGPIGYHSEALCKHAGVIIGRKGAYRGVHYNASPFWVIDTAFYLNPRSDMDMRWAYYSLLTQDINGMDSGSAIPSTSRGDFYALQVAVPSLSEQRAIAHVLGVLDDKIELNRRMNATLEEMARTLFRSWFVDFDPVKAKEAGHKPEGMDVETANLFPDDFEDSEVGRIPKGWKVGSLDLVAQNPRRGTNPRDIEPTTPYIGLEHIPRKSIALYEHGYASEVDSGKFAFEQGEVLFGKLRPYFHKVGLANFNGVCSTDILVISPLKGWSGFVLGHASSVEMIDHATACSDGTRMPRTSWGDLVKYKFAIPDEIIALRYEREVVSLYQQIGNKIREIQTLSNLRDTLLPKLISGEVRLSQEVISQIGSALAD